MQKKTQAPGHINRSQSQHSLPTSQPSANDTSGKKQTSENQGIHSSARNTDEAIDVLSFVSFKL